MTDNMQRARELLEDAMGCAIEHNLSGKVSMPAALDAIAAALRLAVPEWQPIETAPNGVWFLAHSEKGWIGVVRRADPDYAPDEGWFEDEHTEYVHPAWLTHWQPLPAAPTVSAEGEG